MGWGAIAIGFEFCGGGRRFFSGVIGGHFERGWRDHVTNV